MRAAVAQQRAATNTPPAVEALWDGAKAQREQAREHHAALELQAVQTETLELEQENARLDEAPVPLREAVAQRRARRRGGA